MSSALPLYGNRTPEQLKVSELREELKRRGIQCKGLKKELVERLDDAIQKELQEQRNAILAAQAPPDVETRDEPDPESDHVAELNPITPFLRLQPLSVDNEPLEPPPHITNVQGEGTAPPDLNLDPKEAQIEPKEPHPGPKQAVQSMESEAENVEQAVEPETIPDSTPKVNSVPSPYPGGIEVSLHESLSEVPEVANSDANAEQTAEVDLGSEEDHVAKVRGDPNVFKDNGIEKPKSLQDDVLEEPVDGKIDESAVALGDEVLNVVIVEAVGSVLEIGEAVEVVDITKVQEHVETKEEVTVEYKVEEVAFEAAGEGLYPDAVQGTLEVSSNENEMTEFGMASREDEVVKKSGAQSELEVKRVGVEIGTVEIPVGTVVNRVEEMAGGLMETETVETVVKKVEINSETNYKDVKTRDEESPSNLELIPSDRIEHMINIEQVVISHGPSAETAPPADNHLVIEELVSMESLLPEVIPGELTVGRGSVESDEPRELEERDGQVENEASKEDMRQEAEKPKFGDQRAGRRHDRGSRRELVERSDERNFYEKEPRRECGETHSNDEDGRRRYSTGRLDDKARYDDLRRDPLGIIQKADGERQRARPRESSRPELRHSKELHRARDKFLDDRSQLFASSEEQLGRAELTEIDENGKGKEIRPMEVDLDTLAGSKRKEEAGLDNAADADARQLEPTKRQRRWNSGKSPAEVDVKNAFKPVETESLKEIIRSEFQDSSGPSLSTASAGNIPGSTTPKMAANAERFPTSKPQQAGPKADVSGNGESYKLRVVPPSTRAATTSLKIDRFLRPFTFKAVKDLLSQTGTVKDIWMDHIKTHCYITYSSVEEAIATREAVYNLQWPPHGGKFLIAEFVEPEEVKVRSEGSIEKSALTPVTTPRGSTSNSTPGGTLSLPQASSNAPMVNAPPAAASLGPPSRDKPNLPPKREPEPVPTLDDLFRKTRAKPHIYYLPLTGEQVAANIAAVSKAAIPKPPVRV